METISEDIVKVMATVALSWWSPMPTVGGVFHPDGKITYR